MKKSLLVIISILLLGACTSNNPSSNNSNPHSDVFNNYDFGFYMNNVKGPTFTNANFDFFNLDAELSYNGSVIISSDKNSYRIGSSVLSGTVNIDFNEPLLVNAVTFYATANGTSFTQEVTYNDTYSFEIRITKNASVTHYFEMPTLLNSLSFTCAGRDESMLFKGLVLKKADPIKVTGIEATSAIEVEINRFIDISSAYQVLPTNATFKDVVLSSNDEFVKIEDNKVKVMSTGEHQVKVTTVDGNYSTFVTLKGLAEEILNGYRKLDKSRFIYDDIYIANEHYGVVPSKGDVKIIVVPINFSDLTDVYDFNDEESMNKLKAVFEGTNEDYSNDYFESLKSYYYKSSYGNLNLSFDFADVYTPSFTSTEFVDYSDAYGTETQILIEDMYNNLTINNTPIDYADPKYDVNNDGYIDGFWFIYNDNRYETRTNYWPYTYWYRLNSNKKISVYANCSVYFTYEGSKDGLDGHTIFHETGHMLGLEDYYVTSNTSFTSAFGGLGMMDYNIGDHDAFSKFSLGWVNPYVVTDDSYISLRPFESSGDCIVIPTQSFNDSAFGEYIILEYDTPTGLNQFDAENAYVNRPKYYTKNGVRMFHIDARLLEYRYYSDMHYIDANKTSLDSAYNYMVAGSNTPNTAMNDEHLIELITRDNRSTFKGKLANDSSLFIEGDVMDPSAYTAFFNNSMMHDETAFEYKIEIAYMDNEICKIKITK